MEKRTMMSEFHRMEIKYGLYELGKQRHFPLWDMIRVHVYLTYLVGQDSLIPKGIRNGKNMQRRIPRLKSLMRSFFDCTKLLTKRRGKLFFFEFPREVDSNGFFFDRISKQLIDIVPQCDCIVTCNQDCRPTLFHDINIQFLGILKYLSFPVTNLNKDDFAIIENAMKQSFDKDIDYVDINNFYVDQRKRTKSFMFLFKVTKPRKVFVSCDVQKYIFYAARKMGIESYEMQHAGLVFDYPSYSYPNEVSRDWNIAVADNYLLLGKAWYNVNHIPIQRVVIGNDVFFPDSLKRCFKERYLLFISNSAHSRFLLPYAKEITDKLPEYRVVYKLHPNEYENVEKYKSFFGNNSMVSIITSQFDIEGLLACSEGVFIVYSSVFFEALSLGKKVFLLNQGGSSLEEVSKECGLVRNVNSFDDIELFLREDVSRQSNIEFYSHFDYEIAQFVIS